LNMGLFAIGLILIWLIGRPGFLTSTDQRTEQTVILSPTDP
jgi:hypothetical protein